MANGIATEAIRFFNWPIVEVKHMAGMSAIGHASNGFVGQQMVETSHHSPCYQCRILSDLSCRMTSPHHPTPCHPGENRPGRRDPIVASSSRCRDLIGASLTPACRGAGASPWRGRRNSSCFRQFSIVSDGVNFARPCNRDPAMTLKQRLSHAIGSRRLSVARDSRSAGRKRRRRAEPV